MILQAENIKKWYPHLGSRLDILKGIDLKIGQGEIILVVGPSGVGKSTLLHILGGLDHPNEGKVFLDGKDLYSLDDEQRAGLRNTKIGFVFQFYHLFPEFTALENVILPAVIRQGRGNAKDFEKQGMKLLGKVGLKERATHKPNELSGGEQQRVAIARSMMNEPQVIFCDEPTGNLDTQTGEDIIELLVSLNKENNQSLVIVTHDDEIAKHASRTIVMRDGKLIEKQET